MDQVERVAYSVLGKKIMNNQIPKSADEFRRVVPLTGYYDYEPYITERQDEAIAEKAEVWCHSSGRGGKFKWIPYTSKALEVVSKLFISTFILATASKKGELRIKPGERFMSQLPPWPYASGTICDYASRNFYKDKGGKSSHNSKIQKQLNSW